MLLTREWYMHPNGQLPAYEWAFGDVNPPVHAWAAWRVYEIDREQHGGKGDRAVSRARLPQADAELHLVGQPQGRRGPQHFPGRFSRPRQYRHFRPQRAAADRRHYQPVGRHRLDGDVHAEPDAHRARAGARRPRLRGHRHQVLRAFPLYRRGDDQHRRRRHRAVGRGRRVLLRRAAFARRRARCRCGCARWSG